MSDVFHTFSQCSEAVEAGDVMPFGVHDAGSDARRAGRSFLKGGGVKGGDPGTKCTTTFCALCTRLWWSDSTASPFSGDAVFFREQGKREAEDSFQPLGAICRFNRQEIHQLIVDSQRRQPVNYAPSQKRAGIAWVTPSARGDGGLFENGFGSCLEISVRHVQ